MYQPDCRECHLLVVVLAVIVMIFAPSTFRGEQSMVPANFNRQLAKQALSKVWVISA
jgi:beta-lactam-binding protein with PASTA domain